MTGEKLEEVKKYVDNKFSRSQGLYHNKEHVTRVGENALKIVRILNLERKIDKNLLEAIAYLHDITYAYHDESILTFFFEKQYVKKPLDRFFKTVKIKQDEIKIMKESIYNHPGSFPWRRLNKKRCIYARVLQDSDTLDLFNKRRIEPFLENDCNSIKDRVARFYMNYGRNHLRKYLNFPQIFDYFENELFCT